MKLSIIGTEYVGLSTAIGFALKGHQVVCVDVDKSKVDTVNKGETVIYEKGMEEALKQVIGKSLVATSDMEKMLETDISFICVGTPDKNGRQDLSFIEKVSEDIGLAMKKKVGHHFIALKSTVLPGTSEKTVLPLLEKFSGKIAGIDFGFCSNPEFLQEGTALENFLNPDRIVIGEINKKSGDFLGELYKEFAAPILRVDIMTSEMIKYASNAFLAARISTVNELGNICKNLGIDFCKVADGMSVDKRIGPYFLKAGCGFGGSCFPKDVASLIQKAKETGYEPQILEKILETNESQKTLIVKQLENKIGQLSGKTVSILGLAFKAGTDDIREATSISVIKNLLGKGVNVRAYDPKAEANMRKIYPEIIYCASPQDALADSDACLILTDWPEFKELADSNFSKMRQKTIIEGRKILDRKKVAGFDGICW